jgi:hypothetical protein
MTAMMIDRFTLSGKAVPVDAERMLCEICSHFVEHSEVKREGDHVKLESEAGEASFRKQNGCLSIDLSCPSAQMLQLVRSSIAEHLFMFAGEEPLELNWEDQAPATPLPDLSEARVVAVRQITPHMRRLTRPPRLVPGRRPDGDPHLHDPQRRYRAQRDGYRFRPA